MIDSGANGEFQMCTILSPALLRRSFHIVSVPDPELTIVPRERTSERLLSAADAIPIIVISEVVAPKFALGPTT